MNKAICLAMLAMLTLGSLTLVLHVQPVKAWASTGIIYIKADGSVDPSDAPIQRNGDVYTLMDDISTMVENGVGLIGIERDNMTLDGAGHVLHGPGYQSGHGVFSDGRSNVTVKNMQINSFDVGIGFGSSSNVTIFGNSVWSCWRFGISLAFSRRIIVSGNHLADNRYSQIDLYHSSNNTVSGNTASGGQGGPIELRNSSNNTLLGNVAFGTLWITDFSSNNTFLGNNITYGEVYGSYVAYFSSGCSNNSFYHNNFMGSIGSVTNYPDFNSWDEGYPSGGNYWSNQSKADRFSGPYQNESGSDGICDTPFVLSPNSRDHYPLVFPFNSPPTPPVAEFSVQPPSMPMRVQDPLVFNVTSWLPGWNGSHVSPIKEYRWDFGDGNVTSTIVTLVAHAYTHPQTFSVILTTVDNEGLNSSYSQALEVLMPTSVSISTGASSTFVGYAVDIDGTLKDVYGNGLESETVVLKYTFLGANTWVPITSDTTDQLGDYDIMWIPPATGYFTIEAEWTGNSTHLGANNTVSLSSIPYRNQYVFSVESNSTVSAMIFNSTSAELGFTVSGQSGTRGYVKATIAKSLVANTADLHVYIDGSQTEYSVNSLGDTWVLTFTYDHSAHYVTVGWTTKTTSDLTQYLPFIAAAVIAAAVAAIAGYSVLRRRKRKETQAH